ncbi:MAG: corrinoid protein [Deltaproteobacteria bacterium]|nr:corrinoid protein [Deltaproteobacteria bacterium]MBW2285518.1 corrinoid protein [Deltaproteobacteria bacterium]
MADLTEVVDAVFKGKLKDIQDLVQGAMDAGIDAGQILNDALVKGMDVVTRKWKEGQIFVPEVLRSAKTMQLGMDVIRPHLAGEDLKPKAQYAVGTVKGDLHDIGKNLVAMMLESVGYEVVNLGVDLDPGIFVEQVEKGVACIGISALLTTTIPQMKVIIDSIEEAGLRDKCKIWVGGAPVTQEYADEIGADFYSVDAAHCIDQLTSIYG